MIEIPKTIFGVVMALLALLAYVEVRKWDKDTTSQFRLQDLLMKEGRASISKVGQFAALCTSTWGFVYLTIADKLTEWYFLSFMSIWATAKGADKALDIWAQRGKAHE